MDKPSSLGPIFFQIYMWIGLGFLLIYTPLYIARTVTFMEQSADHWWFALWYSLMILGIGFFIYILSRLWWNRSWPQRDSLKHLPEIYTTLAAIVVAGIAYLIYDSNSVWVTEEPTVISQRWLPKYAIALSALTICWTFTAVSISAINAKIRLKGKKYKKEDEQQYQVTA